MYNYRHFGVKVNHKGELSLFFHGLIFIPFAAKKVAFIITSSPTFGHSMGL